MSSHHNLMVSATSNIERLHCNDASAASVGKMQRSEPRFAELVKKVGLPQ